MGSTGMAFGPKHTSGPVAIPEDQFEITEDDPLRDILARRAEPKLTLPSDRRQRLMTASAASTTQR